AAITGLPTVSESRPVKGTRMRNREVRSTRVATAVLPSLPMTRSPSQCPGTWRPSTSAGRSSILTRPPHPRDRGLAVLADDQVALPVPGDLAALDFGGSVVDIDRLPDPRRQRWALVARAGLAAGAQADQLPGQGGHRLGVHPLVDRLVRHPARLFRRVHDPQPPRDPR